MKAAQINGARASRRWFRFAYVSGRAERGFLPHHGRDAEAALALQPALGARGLQYGGPIFNYPPPQAKPVEPIEFDDSFLRPGDLVVLTTRPPLDDQTDGVRGLIPQGFTTLEAKMFACLRQHLVHCSRARVRIADRYARASAEAARLSNVQFRQKRGAAIEAALDFGGARWYPGSSSTPKTVCYLIYERQAWQNGPGLLASFGISGPDTLAWNTVLAVKHPELVASVPFLMAEIPAVDRPSQPPTLEFIRDWKLKLVIPNGTSMQ